jgi:hypothetical protein
MKFLNDLKKFMNEMNDYLNDLYITTVIELDGQGFRFDTISCYRKIPVRGILLAKYLIRLVYQRLQLTILCMIGIRKYQSWI